MNHNSNIFGSVVETILYFLNLSKAGRTYFVRKYMTEKLGESFLSHRKKKGKNYEEQ